MSQSSTSPIDPFEFSTSQDSSSRSGNLEAVPIPSKLARLRDQLATDGGSESTDLALDLVLNEIVQQVRITTRATGAAVALLRGDEMVCRATTGGNAPDMGVRLDTKTGLSGACVETRLTQLCADTELDDRVDVAACRALGVRSILVLPLLDEARLIGVFEVFSPLPSAFGDRDIQTLQAFVRQILQAVGEARLLSSAPIKPSSEAETQAYSYEPELPAIAPPTEVVQGESGPPPQPRRDWLTPFLTVLVIALSILLGTLLGLHASRPKQPRAARRTPGASPTAAASTTNAALEFSGSNAPPLDSEAPTNTQAPSAAAPVNRDKKGPPPRGNLTVYRDERVVYQDGQHIEPAQAPAPASSAPQTATPQSSLLPALPDLPTHTAMALLPKQIDPEYPAGFAASSVQTPVQVRIAVDSTGAVQYARIVSGPNELAAPALDAVKKWHFNPYSVKGTAVPFQTLVTVHFATR